MPAGRARVRRVTAILAALQICTCATEAAAQTAPTPEPTEPAPDAWPSPAKAADPPLLPAPNAPPTSTSGTDLGDTTRASAPVVVADAEHEARQDARVHALEERLTHAEERTRQLDARLGAWRHLRFEGFIQPQFLVQSYNTAASPNLQPTGALPDGIDANDTIAKADGTTTNGTFFRVRRARLRVFHETDVTRLFLQIDALPEGGVGPGIGTILRNAEATGIARWGRGARTEFSAGLFFTPFRRELLEQALFRPFIEATWFARNAFPTGRDYGIHAKTIALGDKLVVDLAVVNGHPLGEKTFVALPDLNRSKDVLLYATYKLGFVTLGASGYVGRGQVVDASALRFKQFDKWAMNYQVSAERTLLRRVGESRLYAELTFGRNMDTGVLYPFAVPRIPADITDDVQGVSERALYVRFEQDVGRHLTVGYRYDTYAPDTSINENARDTHALLVVARITPNLRWMNELDWAFDNVHAGTAPPPAKHILTYSSVLQAMF